MSKPGFQIYEFDRWLGRGLGVLDSPPLELDQKDAESIDRYWNGVVVKRFPNLRRNIPILNLTELHDYIQEATIYANRTYYDAYLAVRNSDLDPPYAELSQTARKQIRPLSVGAVTVTADNRLAMGIRPEGVVAAGRHTPLPQGMLTRNDPYEMVLSRLEEELGITPDYVEELEPLGLALHEDYPDIMIVFRLGLKIDSDKLKGDGVYSIKNEQDVLSAFMEGCKSTGDSLASLLLHGKQDSYWYGRKVNHFERLFKKPIIVTSISQV